MCLIGCQQVSMKNFLNKKEKGVAVLFAVLVAVLLVSIGATIVSIALRQTILSSTGRESQVAFYAANTVMDCALFWDLNPPAPASGDPADQEYVFPVDGLSQIPISVPVTCSGDDFTADWDTSVTDETEFEITITSSLTGKQYCGKAKVVKNYSAGDTTTLIQATGYNLNCSDLTSPRAVERGLELYYAS